MKRTKFNYETRIRQQSMILTPDYRANVFIDSNNKQNLETEILKIQGNGEGMYYNGDRTAEDGGHWFIAEIPLWEQRLASLKHEFAKHQKYQAKMGNLVPKTWPSNIAEDHDRYKAHITVCKEEVKKLQELIEKIKDKAGETRTVIPRREWLRGSGELDDDGILCRIGGWDVGTVAPEGDEEDRDPTLCIVDDRSPYQGMPVWRFKTEVLKPFEREYLYIKNQERKRAERAGTDPIKVKEPESPVYNPKTGKIRYPGYSDVVMNKLNLKR